MWAMGIPRWLSYEHTYIYIYIYIFTHIYIERERGIKDFFKKVVLGGGATI